MTTARGGFDLDSLDGDEYDDVGGTKLSQVRITKTFHGDLEGRGTVTMVSARTPVPTSAVYVAIERIDARLHGKDYKMPDGE